MKSKITIDLDIDNQPVVKIDYFPSEDVRDKMIGRFLEKFGLSSYWCRVAFNPLPDGSIILLRPIAPSELEENSKEMLNMRPLTETGTLTPQANIRIF